MSEHSHTRCWVHFIWGTKNRRPLLHGESAAAVSRFLFRYVSEKNIYMKTNFVNPDHVHALIDLPSSLSIEQAAKLLKGASSYWINQQRLISETFAWGRGYGAFSVSQSSIENLCKYIGNQEVHHMERSFAEEFEAFLAKYHLAETTRRNR